MKKYILILIIFMYSTVLFCQEEYVFSNLVKYGESESFDVSFKNINHSEEFIEKFNLNELEIDFVGYWTNNFYSEIKQNGKNIRICGLDFFPNRILNMNTECFINGERTKLSFFFFWKIENEIVYVKALAYLSEQKNKNKSFVLLKNTDYEPLGKVKFYKNYFILLEQFDFSFMNTIISEKEIEFCMDDFRYRILLGRAMPSIYDKTGSNSNLRKFLLDFDITKKVDFLKLEEDYNRWD